MIELSDASKLHKEQLEQWLDLRVRLFKGWAQTTVIAGATFAGGIATLPGERWVRRLVPVFVGTKDLKVWYSHDGVSFQWWHTFTNQAGGALDMPLPVYCKYVKIMMLEDDGTEVDGVIALAVFEEDMFDLTQHVRDGVTLEFTKERELGNYTMPHVSMPLDNTQRYFVRRNDQSPYWDAVHQVHHCRANARFFIEAMYRGADGKIPLREDGTEDWLPLVTFSAENYSSNPEAKIVTASGSAGKDLLKTRTTQPMHEIITPLELVRDWLIRKDDDRRLFIPINPAARQKTETVYNEYVGEARTFADNWRNVVPLTDNRLTGVYHPVSDSDGATGVWMATHITEGLHYRFGMCSDGDYVFSLVYSRVGPYEQWLVQKFSMEGTLLVSMPVDPPAGYRYIPDITTDGVYLYLAFNTGTIASYGYVYRRKKDFSDSWTEMFAVTGSSEVMGIAYLENNELALFVRTLGGTAGDARQYIYYLNTVTWMGAPAEIPAGNTPANGYEIMEAIDRERIFAKATTAEAELIYVWSESLTFSVRTYELLLDDFGGPLFTDRKKFIYLLRHNLGYGQIAEFGFWLENGNLQYAGEPGHDEALIYPQPLIYKDGQLLDPTGTVSDGILETSDYLLNLETGELQAKGLLPDGVRLRSSYDYKYSLAYVRIDDENRMDVLNDVAVSNNYMVYVNETNELQFRDRRFEEVLQCHDGENPIEDRRLGDTYQAGGLQYIVHPANAAYRFNTLRITSVDRARKLIEGVDYTIAFTDRYYVSFLDTETVREVKTCTVRYRVQKEIPVLKDCKHVTQGGIDEQWGDRDLANDITVKGQKMLPQDTTVSVEQVFAVSPNEDKQASRFANVQEVQPQGQFDWNPASKVVDDDTKPDAQRKYFIEFDQPFVLGTSGYDILYGDARDGGPGAGNGQYGILTSLTQAHNGNHVSAHFYKVALPVTAKDTAYFVMLDNNREWRLAAEADRPDMTDNTTPEDPDPIKPIKDVDFFYVKQMNGNYGAKQVRVIGYYARAVRYFTDRDGRVIEDPAFSSADPRNPFVTVSPDKRMILALTPEDERQNPLFPLHATAGTPGYYGTEDPPEGFNYWTGVLPEFSLRIRRVLADMVGVNFDYDSWSDITNYVRVHTTGHPLTVIEQFEGRAAATIEDIELYGLREKSFENRFVENITAARNVARFVKSIKGSESSRFSVDVVYDAGLALDMLVNVVETFDQVDALFDIVELRDTLNAASPSMSRLVLEPEDVEE